MSNLRALIHQIEKGGLQLSGVRPGVVIRDLSYVEMSNAMDACILDIHKWYPELFNETNGVGLTITHVKMYLFCHAVWFLYQNGSLSFYSGGPSPVSTFGAYVPRGFFKWLAGLGLYEEGGAQGVVAFNISAMPATGGRRGLVSGTPVITDMSQSVYNLSVTGINTVLAEMVKLTSASTSVDYASFWSQHGANISGKLQASGYPCVAFPEEKVAAPDASAWAHPWVSQGWVGVKLSDATSLTCVFSKWNAEAAMLYLDWNTTYAIPPASNVRPLPRPPAVYGYTDIATPAVVADSARVLRENYFFVCRSTADGWDKPILPIFWMGEEIQTLGIVPVPINRGVRTVLFLRVLNALAGTNPSATYGSDNTWKMCAYFVSVLADIRRIQANNPRYEIVYSRGPIASISCDDLQAPRAIESFRLPLLEAQLSSEIGCVVHNGQLHAPFMEAFGCPWYQFFRLGDPSFGGGTSIFNMIGQLFNGTGPILGTNTFDVKGGGAKLDAAWATAYSGLGTGLVSPYALVGDIFGYYISELQEGNNYGRNELTWPASTSPRGGASMLMRGVLSTEGVDLTIRYDGASYDITYYALVAFSSCSTVAPADQALFCAAVPARVVANNDARAALAKTSKFFMEVPVGWSYSPAIEELVSATVNTGGSATLLLAKAIESRHTGGEVIGLTSGVDDVDACLWDALRGAVHTFARIIEPVLPYTAGALCAPGGPAAISACAGASSLINQKLFDLTRDKTNRQSYRLGEAKRALTKDGRDILKHREGNPVLYGESLNQGDSEAGVRKALAASNDLVGQVRSGKPKIKQPAAKQKTAAAKVAKAETKLRKAEKKLVKAAKAAK